MELDLNVDLVRDADIDTTERRKERQSMLVFRKQCRYYHPNMVDFKKLANSRQYTNNSNYEENKQPIRLLQSDRVITATTNARKSWEQIVYREKKLCNGMKLRKVKHTVLM